MGIYKMLHLRNLKRHKELCEVQIKYYHEWLMKINKELKRYEQESDAVRHSKFRSIRGAVMVGVQSQQTDDQGRRE